MAKVPPYEARGDRIYYIHPDFNDDGDLFLTVHPTRDCPASPEKQARIIADLLNRLP